MSKILNLIKRYRLTFILVFFTCLIFLSNIFLVFSITKYFFKNFINTLEQEFISYEINQRKNFLKENAEIIKALLSYEYSRLKKNLIERHIKISLEKISESLGATLKSSFETTRSLPVLIKILKNFYKNYGLKENLCIALIDSNGKILWESHKIEKGFVKQILKEFKNGTKFFLYIVKDPLTEQVQKILFHVSYLKPPNLFLIIGKFWSLEEKKFLARFKENLINVVNNITFGKGGYFFLFNDKGIILADLAFPKIVGTIPKETLLALKQMGNKSSIFFTYYWPNPAHNNEIEPKIAYITRFKPFNWFIGTSLYVQDVTNQATSIKSYLTKETSKLVLSIIIILAVIFVIFILGEFWLIKIYIFPRIRKISRSLKKIKEGEFELELEAKGDELKELEENVLKLSENLKNLSNYLRKTMKSIATGVPISLEKDSFQGEYKKIVEELMEFDSQLLLMIKSIEEFTEKLKSGHFEEKKHELFEIVSVKFPVFKRIQDNLYSLEKEIYKIFDQISELLEAIKEGNIDVSPKFYSFSGKYKEIIDKIEDFLKVFRDLIRAIQEIAEQIAQEKIDQIDFGKYKFSGEYKNVINTLFKIVITLNNYAMKFKNILEKERELYTLRKLIEEDYNLEEVYERLKNFLVTKFNLKKFYFYEVNQKDNTIKCIISTEKHTNVCNPKIFSNAQRCRAKRSGKIVISEDVEWGPLCESFIAYDKFNHICIPFVVREGVGYVLLILFDKKEKSLFNFTKENLKEIEFYIKNVLPAIEIRKLVEELKEKSVKDGLTELYNRHFMEEYLNTVCELAKRSGRKLGIMMIDLDHFKQVNDTYGHDVGDEVLKALGNLMKNSFRKSDVIIRYGGEEFLVILHDVKDRETLLEIAENLRKKVENFEFNTRAGKLKRSISIGISIFPDDSDNIREVIKFADLALYKAKRTGRNRVVAFTQDLIKEIV